MDYRIELKVKNNRILERIEEAGYKTVGEFCRLNPTIAKSVSLIGDLINMKTSPLNSDGEFRPFVMRLCDALVCSPEDLFTQEQFFALLESNKRIIKVNEAQAKFMLSSQKEQLSLEDQRALDERSQAINEMLETITPREAKVIKMRFGLGEHHQEYTLEETAKACGVTRERIRQIEAKACGKMRHPARSNKVRELSGYETFKGYS